MEYGPSRADRINSFALVSYIPDKLGEFFCKLRQELVQGCTARAHVTVLPPRQLTVDTEAARQWLAERVPANAAFEVSFTDIEVFPRTFVIYAEIGEGRKTLLDLHRSLNTCDLQFDEPYPYHPHVTLAQDLAIEDVQAAQELAVRRWREYRYSRRYSVEQLAFVQNQRNCWVDLAEYDLRGIPELPVG
jgi:2'-5' RNA ligase